jgi:hypothetical protein
MSDLGETGPSLAQRAKYEPFVAKFSALSRDFAKPELLSNGDSHQYRSDNPPSVRSAGNASTLSVNVSAGPTEQTCSTLNRFR